jgi:two-component system response regulator AtoC
MPGMSTSGQLAGVPQTPALPEDDGGDPDNYSLKERIGKVVAREEKRLIAEVLAKTNWNRRKASELLDISYRSLLYKIKDYNLNSTK